MFLRIAGVAVLCSFLVSGLSSAQDHPIDPGVFGLDGTISFRSQGGDIYSVEGSDDRQTTASIEPAGFYFIAPGVAVGGQLRLARSSQDVATSTTLGIGPTALYYFGEPDAEVLPFVGANLLLLRRSSSVDLGSVDIGFGDPVELGEEDITLTGLAFDIQAGFTYMLARNVGVTTAAFFLYERVGGDNVETQTGNTVGVQVGITAFIF
jgi:hypothetical protein